MSLTLSFILSVVATLALVLVPFYFTVVLIFGGRKALSRPRMGVTAGTQPDTLGVWVHWNTDTYDIQFYRILVSVFCPEHAVKEGRFTVTFDPAHKKPFYQLVKLPLQFQELLDKPLKHSALFSISVRTHEEIMVESVFSLAHLQFICRGVRFNGLKGFFQKFIQKPKKVPRGLKATEAVEPDVPFVTTLDYEELKANKTRVSALITAAKAKEAAAKKAAEAKAAKAKAAEAAKTSEKAPSEKKPEASVAASQDEPKDKPKEKSG